MEREGEATSCWLLTDAPVPVHHGSREWPTAAIAQSPPQRKKVMLAA
jgi:hypothetical protein